MIDKTAINARFAYESGFLDRRGPRQIPPLRRIYRGDRERTHSRCGTTPESLSCPHKLPGDCCASYAAVAGRTETVRAMSNFRSARFVVRLLALLAVAACARANDSRTFVLSYFYPANTTAMTPAPTG